jgi:HAD superfamily hydrolase (TIGR01509 family)
MKKPIPPAAIVFDMDGVLVDSERAWYEAENDYLRKIAPGYTEAHHHLAVGVRLKDLYQTMCERFGATLSYDDFRAHYAAVGKDIYAHHADPIAHAADTLAALHQKKIPLGLASSSPHAWIDTTLKRFGIQSYFDVVISGEDVEAGKPAPHIYLAALAGLGQTPETCWAVEDATVGLESASSAGLWAIGFRNGGNENQSFAAAHQVIHTLTEIIDF